MISEHVSEEIFTDKIKILSKRPWKMRDFPWEICVKETGPDGQIKWKMINEGRTEAIKLVGDICQWLTDDDLKKMMKLSGKKLEILKHIEAEKCFNYLLDTF